MMINYSLRNLAAIAYAANYADIPDRDMLIDYLRSERMIAHDETPLSPADFHRAIDDDIHDLLHNANLTELLPFADELPDLAYESLSDFIDDQRFSAMITRRILATIR